MIVIVIIELHLLHIQRSHNAKHHAYQLDNFLVETELVLIKILSAYRIEIITDNDKDSLFY